MRENAAEASAPVREGASAAVEGALNAAAIPADSACSACSSSRSSSAAQGPATSGFVSSPFLKAKLTPEEIAEQAQGKAQEMLERANRAAHQMENEKKKKSIRGNRL